MKLKNKKTGEIGELHYEPDKEYHFTVATEDPADIMIFKTLTELNKEWEDYEEPKEHYFITEYGEVFSLNEYEGFNNVANPEDYKQIGIYFETKEEAEKAVERLKKLQILRNKGYKIDVYFGHIIKTGEE